MSGNGVVAQRSVDVEGKAFANHFYSIVRYDPELVRRFYSKNNNIIPELQVIIPDLREGDVHIKEVYSVKSISGGMTVFVRGHLTRKDGVCQSFIHAFHLDTGYYITYSIFKYTENSGHEHPAEKGQFSESKAQKAHTLSCPICMNQLDKVFSTICGHVFCEGCIRVSIIKYKVCPLCKNKLEIDNFHRVYLPGAE